MVVNNTDEIREAAGENAHTDIKQHVKCFKETRGRLLSIFKIVTKVLM